jgi:TolB protein
VRKLLLAALLLLPALVWAGPAPVIQISGANFKPLPLAITAPRVADDGARTVAPVFDDGLMFDLTASGLFQVLDRKSFLASPNEGMSAATIDFTRWMNVGADALVKTQLSTKDGQLHADLKLFTVSSGNEAFQVSHDGPVENPRALAHWLADALYQHFTREPGPFQSHLVFVRKSPEGKDVLLSDWDGRNAKAVAEGGLNLLPAITPDGKGAAFTSFRSGKGELWVAEVDGKARPLVSAATMATGVSYSPDGKRIAFASARGEGTQIMVANADGSHAHAITKTPYFINTSPCWSPDGRRIAFVSNRAGSPQIYVMSADGSNVRRLTFQGNYNQTPSWSPRGDLIAFTARDERNAFDLFTVNVETGKVARLTQDQGNNEEPSFSPNGRLIVFSSTRTGPSRLYVMTAEGNNQWQLPADKGQLTTPDWGK